MCAPGPVPIEILAQALQGLLGGASLPDLSREVTRPLGHPRQQHLFATFERQDPNSNGAQEHEASAEQHEKTRRDGFVPPRLDAKR